MTTTPGPEFSPAESADKWFRKWDSLGKLGSATDHDTEDDEDE
jgi:hypothetical protein